VFGDGLRGAIPPSGQRHVTARYRVGLGVAGNIPAGQVARVVQASPLVERVVNPTAIGGGTEPAGPEDVRRQATRYLRTFDRAVSVSDHADLALLFPGVARAAAWIEDGIALVAARHDGAPLDDDRPLFEFLEARRDTSLPLRARDPRPLDVACRVHVEIDPAYLERDVQAGVRAALHGTDPAAPGTFTFAARDLGQAAHASEVYQRIASVPGVASCQLLVLDLAPGAALCDVLRPRLWQWLRLPPANLSFAPREEADHD
jgi:predicted phage baseplate assembly protein